MVYPDPVGFNEQGTVGNEPDYRNDAYVSNVASEWLKNNARSEKPWCLTVSFVNPHDKEFFWAGTEFLRYNALMRDSNYEPFTYYSTASGSGAPRSLSPRMCWAIHPHTAIPRSRRTGSQPNS